MEDKFKNVLNDDEKITKVTKIGRASCRERVFSTV